MDKIREAIETLEAKVDTDTVSDIELHKAEIETAAREAYNSVIVAQVTKLYEENHNKFKPAIDALKKLTGDPVNDSLSYAKAMQLFRGE